jgi:hypothetical protein
MKKHTWLLLIALLFSMQNVFAENCKNDIKLIFDEGEAKCLAEFPNFFKFDKMESQKINSDFFKSKQTISFAGATNKGCGATWGVSWGSSTPLENDKEAINWCKKEQNINCTCRIILSADAPLRAVKVKIPRKEFIERFQSLQESQTLTGKEDVKQNELETEVKKVPEGSKEKIQIELKLAKEAQEREVAISEAKEKAQQELRLSQEAQAREAALAKLKEEEYEKEKQSAAAKARVLEEIKAEAYAKEKAILEAKAKAQADLKAEEIAKKKAVEQAKAQAIIDEKNRVAAAKAAEAHAKKNRELEIAEEKRKIAESQKKLEVLKNKPLEIVNSTVANQSKSETSNKKTRIPIFTLACGAMGGQPFYRIVSNGSDIFFGSERNINDAQKGYEIQVTERQIKFKLKSGSENYGMPEPQMELYRDILSAFSKQFVDKSIYPPDGIHTVSYKCQTIEDDNIFNSLKNAYESRSAETKKKKQEYDSRPNKI